MLHFLNQGKKYLQKYFTIIGSSQKRAEALCCKARLAADYNLIYYKQTNLAREVDQILALDI